MAQLGGAHLMVNFVSHGSAAPLMAQLNGPYGCNSLNISEYVLYEQ
jgi:hypothetical protein